MSKSALREGGPGSGVKYRNTVPIDMPMSEYISVGTRKGLTQNSHWDEFEIPLNMITKVGQANYVPSKVNKMMQSRDLLRTKPIDVLWVRGDGYHLVDGHHRFLAAKALNIDALPARVFQKAEKTMPDYVHDNPEKEDEMDMATRTTDDAENRGWKTLNLKMAAESFSKGNISVGHKILAEESDFSDYDVKQVLAGMIGGKIDSDGNISWEDAVGKHVLSFNQDGSVKELQDVTGVYKLGMGVERLLRLIKEKS